MVKCCDDKEYLIVTISLQYAQAREQIIPKSVGAGAYYESYSNHLFILLRPFLGSNLLVYDKVPQNKVSITDIPREIAKSGNE